jgi:hypothetical protein
VLNKSNGRTLAELFGDDCDEWTGKKVEMFSAMTEYQGRTVEGLRLRAPLIKGKDKKAPAVDDKKDGGDFSDLDDEIPF